MKNKKIIRLFTAALAVALCATAFAVPAFAGGGEGEPYYTETAGTEADPAEDAEAPEVTITMRKIPPAMIARTITRRQTGTPWTRSPNCWAAWGL